MERDYVVSKLQQICEVYSDILGKVILFGSYSRNEATDKSDIDLYIEPKDKGITSENLGANKRYKEFKYVLYDSFPCGFDLLSFGGKRDLNKVKQTPLWTQIKKDGVLIYDQGAETI